MNKQEKIALSVIDVEQKYTVDPAETISASIVSWGANNDLPYLLSNCYDKSATLKAAIDQSINYVCGDDVVVNEKAGLWQKQINRRGETMKDLIDHISYDYFVYGNFAIQVVFNALGLPVELFPLDVSRCRLNEDGTKVLYSNKKWTKFQKSATEYDRFGEQINPENATQIYFWNAGGIRRRYNRPMWYAALDDALTEVESSHYCLNNVVNGFGARYIINLPQTSNLTDEQKEAISDGIKSKFCGPDADSNFMLYWMNGESDGLDVKKIDRTEDPEYLQAVRNGARENIFISLRLSPLLCGLGSEKTGFATAEYRDSYKLYDRSVAEPIRHIFEATLSKITGIEDVVNIVPFSIKFEEV